MANVYTTQQTQKSVLDKLYNRYDTVVKKVKLAGEPLTSDRGEKTTLPRNNFQALYQQKVDYEASSKIPRLITVKDLQEAINYLEGRFTENCDCASIAVKCQTCQAQCSYDSGSQISGLSCQYTTERVVCQSYACQTLKCQTISSIKSCEVCQSCQLCQKDDDAVGCQSCQLFSCQTLRCETAKPQCVCQTCQTNCSQCSCQSLGTYKSCQSQCTV